MSCLRNHFQVQGHENVLSCFLEEFKFCYSFSCYIDMYVFDSFWVDLCLRCEIRGLASFFCIWISSCLNTSWWRDCSLLYWIVEYKKKKNYKNCNFWHPCQKLVGQRRKGLFFFLDSKLCSTGLCFYPFARTPLFDACTFQLCFAIEKCVFSSFILLFHILVLLFGISWYFT